MDHSWCPSCDRHIDWSDTDLYCSEACRKADEMPQLSNDKSTPLSPYKFDSPSPTLPRYTFSPYQSYPVPNKVSPPSFSLGLPRNDFDTVNNPSRVYKYGYFGY